VGVGLAGARVLEPDLGPEPPGVDHQKPEILLSAKKRVRHRPELVGERAVDEPLPFKARRGVKPHLPRPLPVLAVGDMEEPHRTNLTQPEITHT